MNGERGRGAEEAEGEGNESARRLRAREPLFLDLAHFSMPVDSYPNLPSLSFSRASSSLLSSTYSAPLRSFGSLARLLHLRRVRHLLPPFQRQTVSSTTYTLSQRTTTSTRFRARRFQKTVRARVRPASLVTTDKRC